MKKRRLDDQYWKDALMAFYIDGNYGKYADAVERFKAAYPEYRDYLKRTAADRAEGKIEKDIETEIIRAITARFRSSDQQEQEPAPTPEHLRQTCLPFHIDVPPMSQSVNAFDGAGRLSLLDASINQHRRHQAGLKQFHRRGFVYREANEQATVRFGEQVEHELSDIEFLKDLPVRRVQELLQERKPDHDVTRDDENAETPPPTL